MLLLERRLIVAREGVATTRPYVIRIVSAGARELDSSAPYVELHARFVTGANVGAIHTPKPLSLPASRNVNIAFLGGRRLAHNAGLRPSLLERHRLAADQSSSSPPP
jgi:hypothetical protein